MSNKVSNCIVFIVKSETKQMCCDALIENGISWAKTEWFVKKCISAQQLKNADCDPIFFPRLESSFPFLSIVCLMLLVWRTLNLEAVVNRIIFYELIPFYDRRSVCDPMPFLSCLAQKTTIVKKVLWWILCRGLKNEKFVQRRTEKSCLLVWWFHDNYSRLIWLSLIVVIAFSMRF
jgi:hypothetical protein